jgi:hypothetical protein
MQEITFSVLHTYVVLTRENHILHKLGTTCDGKLDKGKRRKEKRKRCRHWQIIFSLAKCKSIPLSDPKLIGFIYYV